MHPVMKGCVSCIPCACVLQDTPLLTLLDLSRNRLTTLPSSLLLLVPGLEALMIDGNRLSGVDAEAVSGELLLCSLASPTLTPLSGRRVLLECPSPSL